MLKLFKQWVAISLSAVLMSSLPLYSSFVVPKALAAAVMSTDDATDITVSDATLNGTNDSFAATGHSFWVSTSTFDTSSPTIPSGVYSTPDMGALAGSEHFSATPSSLTTSGLPTHMPAVTPNTEYYFVAWTAVGGTWYPGDELNFTTDPLGSVFIDSIANGILDPGELTFATIQAAIDDSTSAGNTIIVGAGTYPEYLTINTDNLTIRSQSGAPTTIIDVQGHANEGVGIHANQVTIDGFTIQGSTTNPGYEMRMVHVEGSNNVIRNNVIIGDRAVPEGDGTQYGIYVRGPGGTVAINNNIENNEVKQVRDIGIEIYGASGNTTSGNFIRSNNIHDITYYGITIDRSPGNTITQNTISNLFGDTLSWGIILWGDAADGNQITNQTLTGLPNGIVLSSANNTVVDGATVTNNTGTGIKIAKSGWAGGIPIGNVIKNSIIRNNTTGVQVTGGVGDIGTGNVVSDKNTISGNTSAGIDNTSAVTIDTTSNWWGVASGPFDNKVLPGIPDYNNLSGTGNSVTSYVDYKSWFIDAAMTTLSDVATINSFDFDGLSPAVTGTVDKSAKTADLTVPAGTNVTNLVPTISITGESVSPASGVGNDFTSPKPYTVTSYDETVPVIYTVTVTVAPDIDPPVISNINSTPTTTGETMNISATITDNVGVVSAKININGAGYHTMDYAGGDVYTYTYAIPETSLAPITYTIQASDVIPNTATSALQTITPTDNDSPVIGTVTGNAGNTGSTTLVTVPATDNIAPVHAQIGYGSGWVDMTGSTSPFTFNVPIPLNSTASVIYFVRVFDAAGMEADSGPYTITVTDNVNPVGSVVINGGDTYTTSKTVNLTLPATDNIAVTDMCIKTGTSVCTTTGWEAYTSPESKTYTWAAPGNKTIYVWYRDAAGNISARYSDSIYYDGSVPTDPSSLTTSPNPTNALSQFWNWAASTDAGSGILGYWYKIAGDTSVDWTFIGNITTFTTNLAQGVYNFFVRSQDNAGNYSNEVSQSLTVDTTNPTVNLNGVISPTKINDLSYTGFVTDPSNTTIAQADYRIDGGGWILANATDGAFNGAIEAYNFSTGILADGSHTIEVRALDVADNESAYTSDSVFIDTAAPTTTDNIDGNWYNSAVTVTLTCGDGTGTGCAATYYKIDGVTPYLAYDSLTGIQFSSAGTYTIKYYSEDGVGNSESEQTAINQVKIDTTDPSSTVAISGTYGPNSTPAWSGGVSGTASDPNGAFGSGLSSVDVTITNDLTGDVFDGADFVSGGSAVTAIGTTSWSVPLTSAQLDAGGQGLYTIESHATDNAGNVESTGIGSFTWDSVPPKVSGVEDGKIYSDARTIDVMPDAVTITLNGNPFVSGTTVGANDDYELVATDANGNSNVIHFIIDIAPKITETTSSEVTTTTATITWTTDQPATSRVVYDTVSHSSLGIAPNYGYANSTVEDATKVINHSVTIIGLSAGTTYYFRTISAGSPETVSAENTFTTSSEPEQVVDDNVSESEITRGRFTVKTVQAPITVAPAPSPTVSPTVSATSEPEVKGEETEQGKTTPWWYWLILAILVVAAGTGGYYYSKKNKA